RLGESVRQGTLSEHVGIEGPSLVRLLDQLCAAGLARRDEDPHDRRAKTISLTAAGRSVTTRMEEDLRVLRAQVLKGITRADLEATLRVLDAFNTADAHHPASRPPHPADSAS
ncbi:MarR family winged helix-turn-helix transcriptional regulator, partial [Burkholderia gladioli]|uniref:MarR family winged helix-turn-helix transcriptional regulator n=1 Tax=Burkholderia gladioli TaxID=28095 RepID=UPI00163E1BED